MRTFLTADDAYCIMRSNHGNHSGYNRKWELMGGFSTLARAKSALVDLPFEVSDRYVMRQGRAYDTENKCYICTNKDTSFWHDGRTYCIVSYKEATGSFFSGERNGYTPDFIEYWEYDVQQDAMNKLEKKKRGY